MKEPFRHYGTAEMGRKILITLFGNDVAPRFDLATELFIAVVSKNGRLDDEKTMVLAQPSAEKLCHMIITEDVSTVICGGIEEEYYQYLKWKRIEVIDSVIGPLEKALERFCKGELKPGDVLFEPKKSAH